MRVAEAASFVFALPGWPYQGFDGPCPHRLKLTYLGRAHLILSEAAQIADLPQDERQWLLAAAANVATFSSDRLRISGFAGETHYCRLERPADDASIPS